MPKNIVVLSDGTGQVGGEGHDTNIYKLYRMLEDRTDNQIVYYDQGLGTDGQKVAGLAFGRGFGRNIQDCYKFIFDHYQSGDRIFLFGFSRGAATVRSLASFIHYFGILPSSRPELIQEAYRIYENRKQDPPVTKKASDMDMRNRSYRPRLSESTFSAIDKAAYRLSQVGRKYVKTEADEFVRKHPNQWASIEFLGVWDTVPALGFIPIPGFDKLIDHLPTWRHRYHDFKLHESVRNAYHALSIDDDRVWFFPTIWKECAAGQKMEQVWFGGSHTDVGGGFWEAGFSDIALEWMMQKALQHGIRLYLGSRKNWNFCVAPDATDLYHPARVGAGKIYAYGLRDHIWDHWMLEQYGPPRLHESVLERAEHDPTYRPWILTQYPSMSPQFWDAFPHQRRRQYQDESFTQYQDWRKKADANGMESPLELETWRKLPENSFEAWQQKNPIEIRELDGKKFIVECAVPVAVGGIPLRDYDRMTLSGIQEKDFEMLHERTLKPAPAPRRWRRQQKTAMVEITEIPSRVKLDQKRWEPLERKTHED